MRFAVSQSLYCAHRESLELDTQMQKIYTSGSDNIEPHGCLKGEVDFENAMAKETNESILRQLWTSWYSTVLYSTSYFRITNVLCSLPNSLLRCWCPQARQSGSAAEAAV